MEMARPPRLGSLLPVGCSKNAPNVVWPNRAVSTRAARTLHPRLTGRARKVKTCQRGRVANQTIILSLRWDRSRPGKKRPLSHERRSGQVGTTL